MIRVDWDKIKPFEKKGFALPVLAVLILFFIISVVIGFISPLLFMPLKFLTGVFIFLVVAFHVHIESRMLQLYMLLGVLDVSFLCAALIPVPKGLTIFFFAASAAAAFFSVISTITAGVLINKDTLYNSPEPNRENIYAGKNVLMFAPHEDDEINLYGGIIEQYVKNGSAVRIVFSTNGDYHGIGRMRMWEALRVAGKYGIPEENIIFLGYSDSLVNAGGLHIYNCKPDEVIASHLGRSETYGSKQTPPFGKCSFTRENILQDFKNVILKYKPDTIFCCDYDSHMDHRALSLFFEEALGSILKENPFYYPQVYKGFAYSTAWNGKPDYYSLNMLSTRLEDASDYMEETNVYRWEDRIRFPVAKECLSRVMQNSSGYKAMMEYSSQTATDHAKCILNADKVFWKRRTDSVLYDAQITATSGDASSLLDFKLVDSEDINNNPGLPLRGVWTADAEDDHKIIAIKLPAKKKIGSVVLYESPEPDNHIMNAVIRLGAVSYNTGELKGSGAATIFEFPPVATDMIAIKIKSYIGNCSLLKIEAFEAPESEKAEFIKLQNRNGDFCYDYIINKSGKEQFTVYTYPKQENFEFEVSTDNADGVRCRAENGVITVNCPEGESAVLTVISKENHEIYDSVLIRNPDERERDIISIKQRYEERIPSFPMQWDYYRGLLRRLAVYAGK